MSAEQTVLAILQTACESDTPAALMSATMALSCPGRLVSASRDGVVIEFLRSPPGALNVHDLCAVTFPLGGRTVGFQSKLIDADHDAGGRSWVTLALPLRLRYSEQRLSVRVPVPDDTLRVAIHIGERVVTAHALDMSLHGILLEVDEQDADQLDIGHRRMIELDLAPHQIVLESEVRRVDAPRFGLLFIRRDEMPRALTKIVAELQRRWSEQ